MRKTTYHNKIKTQIQHLSPNVLNHPDFIDFLDMVNKTYEDFDKKIDTTKYEIEKRYEKLAFANTKLIEEGESTKTKLENIIDNIEGVIFETDLDGNFTFLNNVWTDYSGFPKKNSIGKSFKDFLKTNAIEIKGRTNEKWLKEKRHIRFVFKHEKKNKLRWFEVKAKLVSDQI